jgi:transcriptional regulator with XRE-family HTH domain
MEATVMDTVGARLRRLREGIGLSQQKIANMFETAQPNINRYEHNQSDAPYRILRHYADYFDVSLDYILCRTDKPQGVLYNYEPDVLKEKMAHKEDWQAFVEACFDPRSPMYSRLKDLVMNMAAKGGDEP